MPGDRNLPEQNISKTEYQLVKDLTSEKYGGSSTSQDRSGKCFTEKLDIFSRWTEYCSNLHNHASCGDNAVSPQEKIYKPIFREAVEIGVASLKKGEKSAGLENILAELVQAGLEGRR